MMLKSKYFWIAMVVLVPFIIIWIMEGLAWAVGTLVGIGIVFLAIWGNTRRRRYYYYDEDDEDDEEVIIVKRPRRRSSSSNRMRDLYIPKVDKDFYVPSGLRNIHQDGLNDLGQRQKDDLKRTLKRLRR